jgi:hypothetical protein
MIGPCKPPAWPVPYRFWVLAAEVLVIGGVWLWLLPALETLAPIARHIRCQSEAGIDPSALFYTELPLVEELARRREAAGSKGCMGVRWLHTEERMFGESP